MSLPRTTTTAPVEEINPWMPLTERASECDGNIAVLFLCAYEYIVAETKLHIRRNTHTHTLE